MHRASLLLLALLLIPARPAAAASPAPGLVLGEINPLTGRFAAQGSALHQGIVYAVEEANSRGGAGGRPVVLHTRDDESRPERAIAAAEELIGRLGAVALVGGYVDSLVGPISEVAERRRTPYLATASLDERLTQRGYRYFFRVSSLPPYVNAIAGFLTAVRPASVAILYSGTPGASQLARRQREALERAGLRVAAFDQFTAGTADFLPHLLRVRAAGAEFLVLNGFFADNLLVARQLREHRIPVKGFLGTFGMEFPAVIERLGQAAEGLLGTTSWEPGITAPGTEEAARAFTAGFRHRFGSPPDPLSMHGYAAARGVLEAGAQAAAAGLTPQAVRDALARLDLLLPLGRLRFDEQGEPLHYERVIIQIQGGRHVVVHPPARATGRLIYPLPR